MLTAVSLYRNIVERFKPLHNHLFAVLANGELLQTQLPSNQTDLTSLNWEQILPDVGHVDDVTIMM